MRRALEGDPVGGGSSQRWCRERAVLRQPPASTPGTHGCHRAGPAGDQGPGTWLPQHPAELGLAPVLGASQPFPLHPRAVELLCLLLGELCWPSRACSGCWGWKVAVAPGGRVPSGCQTSSHGAQPRAAAGACPRARPARAVLAAGARCRAPGEQPGTRQVWLLRLPLAKVLGLQHFVMIFISSPSSDPSLLTLPK